jgi:hypothetical protein
MMQVKSHKKPKANDKVAQESYKQMEHMENQKAVRNQQRRLMRQKNLRGCERIRAEGSAMLMMFLKCS